MGVSDGVVVVEPVGVVDNLHIGRDMFFAVDLVSEGVDEHDGQVGLMDADVGGYRWVALCYGEALEHGKENEQ